MEGMDWSAPVSLEVLTERVRTLDARTRSNHDTVARMREVSTKRGEQFVRLEQRLDNQDEDLDDLKKTLNRILWGLFGAIAVGLMFVVAVASLIIQNS